MRGRYVDADEIYGENKAGQIKKSPLPPDEMVDEPHYMHNLITGVYWLSGENIALSIQLNPTSKWESELDRNHPTMRINYDFGSDPKYKPQIKKLENCFRDDIPIGIIFKTVKAKNKLLGLGKVVSYNSTKFVIDSYGISSDQSKLLKEETIREFDKSLADPEFSKIEEINYSRFLLEINFDNGRFRQNLVKSPEPRRVRINQIIESTLLYGLVQLSNQAAPRLYLGVFTRLMYQLILFSKNSSWDSLIFPFRCKKFKSL